MPSVFARKTLTGRSAFALAAILINGVTCAAEMPEGGHAQARDLLSAAPVARTDRASTALPAADPTALASDAHELARSLLAGAPFDRQRGGETGNGVAGSASAANAGAANAGAQESARRMILGRGV